MSPRTSRKLSDRALMSAIAGSVRLKALIRRSRHLEGLFYRAVNKGAFARLAVHDRMLADPIRVEAYAKGIAANVNEGDVVVDVGTGVGILACLAAREHPRRVYAIDQNVVDFARLLAAGNGLGDIEFQQTHSATFDPGEPVDVIVHEQIGNWTFDERMVTNITELRDRVLRPGGRVLPNRIDVYLEPVEIRPDYVVPLIWEHRIEGLDFSSMRSATGQSDEYPTPINVFNEEISRLLCEPEPALTIDLEKDGPGALPRRIHLRRPAIADGTQHGVVLYFDAHFDDEHSISNSPLVPRTHWGQALLRNEATPRKRGEMIEFELTAEDLERWETWRWRASRSGSGQL